jgi:hypothetical protein
LGSVCAVGSWFCISVTSKERKSFAVIPVDGSVEVALPDPLVAAMVAEEVEASLVDGPVVGVEAPSDCNKD